MDQTFQHHIQNNTIIPSVIMNNQLHYLDGNLWNDIDCLPSGFDEAQLDFSKGSFNDLDNEVLDLDEIINAIPLNQPLDPRLAPLNLLEEFNIIFNDLSYEIEKSKLSNMIPTDDQKKESKGKKRNEGKLSTNGEKKVLTFEQVSRYFYLPITQAAKELNIGLTLLKKKCRELGIPRWPHRQMKSMQTLIRNVQELERENGEVGEREMKNAVEILEQEKKLMEKDPCIKMEENTKRLRQACFKAKFKKRRLQNQFASKDTSDQIQLNPTADSDVNDYTYSGARQC